MIVNPHLNMVKKSNVTNAAIGDTITYTVTCTNDGNVDLNNVAIQDILSSSLEFVPGSVTINNVPSPNANIISGLQFTTVPQGATIVITFNTIALSSGGITNQTNSNYTFIPVIGKPPQGGSNTSNIITVNVSNVSVLVSKTSNVDFAVLGNTINYTITVNNNGSIDATNVILSDILPRYLQLVDGSFVVNGNVIYSVDLTQGVNIGTVKAGTTATVNYQARVISSSCDSSITNTANVNYSYTLADGSVGEKQAVGGVNKVNVINMGISNFKQLSVEEYLIIPTQKPDIETINSVNGTIDIVKCHVVSTGVIKSTEGQNLSGYKLVVHGILREIVEYTACDEAQSIHSAHYDIPFSTFIVLPVDFVPGSKIEVEGSVEDIYNNSIDCRVFFTNATLLINAKILFC